MKPPALLGLLLPALLTGCGITEIKKPLFSSKDSDVQLFPIFPGNNGQYPILPGDTVKTEAQAVRIGMNNCGHERDDPKHWYAHRNGEIWVVRWNVGENSIYAEVRKSDGTFADCDVRDPVR